MIPWVIQCQSFDEQLIDVLVVTCMFDGWNIIAIHVVYHSNKTLEIVDFLPVKNTYM